MIDAITVHKYLRCKFIAEYNKLQFSLYEDTFILLSEIGKRILVSKDLDDMIKELDNYDQVGYYTS